MEMEILKSIEEWADAHRLSEEEIILAVRRVLPSWKVVGVDYGIWQRNGWRRNYLQIRKRKVTSPDDIQGICFWEYDRR